MKVNEFETKLATVSDAKLLQMLGASRSTGPEVAVDLILSECKRRGLEEPSDKPAASPFASSPSSPSEFSPSASATNAYAHDKAGYADAEALVAESAGEGVSVEAAPAEAGVPPIAPDWLTEESKSRLPVFVKVLIVLVGLVGALGLAWKISH
jgi:hypothetical protein